MVYCRSCGRSVGSGEVCQYCVKSVHGTEPPPELEEKQAEALKIAKAALKSARSMVACIKHNCPVDALFLALDVSQNIVMEHIDRSQVEVIKALKKIEDLEQNPEGE